MLAPVAAELKNKRLLMAAVDTADAILEKLEDWQPPHRAN